MSLRQMIRDYYERVKDPNFNIAEDAEFKEKFKRVLIGCIPFVEKQSNALFHIFSNKTFWKVDMSELPSGSSPEDELTVMFINRFRILVGEAEMECLFGTDFRKFMEENEGNKSAVNYAQLIGNYLKIHPALQLAGEMFETRLKKYLQRVGIAKYDEIARRTIGLPKLERGQEEDNTRYKNRCIQVIGSAWIYNFYGPLFGTQELAMALGGGQQSENIVKSIETQTQITKPVDYIWASYIVILLILLGYVYAKKQQYM